MDNHTLTLVGQTIGVMLLIMTAIGIWYLANDKDPEAESK